MPVDRVSVQLYTKPHIKAYLLNNFGEKPLIGSAHIFHNYTLSFFKFPTVNLTDEQYDLLV